MADDDRYPTVRQVLDGEASFPANARHDENGMYVMPDPDPPPDMIQAASGLFLPKPKTKAITRIVFDNGLPLDVSESMDEVRRILKEHKPGTDVVLTGPVFEDEPVVILNAHVKAVRALVIDYKDISEIETSLKQREIDMELREKELARLRAQNLGQFNGRKNRR